MYPPRFYLLDILRGLAALVVVVWHYQHFFFTAPGQYALSFKRDLQPFYFLISPFYNRGLLAVQLFFVLSGFIFFWLYQDAVRNKMVSGYRFFILRFSRLYPLHFVTLILVLLVQSISQWQFGNYFIYAANDLKHFLLQLLLASYWGFQDGYSFNGPVWSVSIEVMLYALFFIISFWLKPRWGYLVILALLGYLVELRTNIKMIGIGIFCFYIGGLTFQIFRGLRTTFKSHKLLFLGPVVVSATSIIIVALIIENHREYGELFLFTLFYPSLILALAILQDMSHRLGRSIRLLGDISYSIYLLHFPLQLLIHYAVEASGATVDFMNPYIFTLFLSLLIGLSYLCYTYFEMPMKKLIRKQWR